MLNPIRFIIFIFFILNPLIVLAQNNSNIRSRTFVLYQDSISLDSLLIVPHSEIVIANNKIVHDSLYKIDYPQSVFISSNKIIKSGDSITIRYRVFVDFSVAEYSHRDLSEIINTGPVLAYPENRSSSDRQSFFTDNQLDKRGSISRGIVMGNNQDASVSSNLNLQISGKLSDNLNILAAISDENIPIQPDGNSQQLQEFDKVFIQIYNENTKLIAGDFEITKPTGYFLNNNKKGQGGLLNSRFVGKKNKSVTFETTISGAVAKGKYCRKTFNGQEGNQGPYKLSGCENELYIIVLGGSELVFIDGKQKIRGKENDYIIDYNTGEIIFTANCPITKDSRIAIEFEYSEKSYARFMVSNSNLLKSNTGSFWINIFSEHDSKNQPLTQDLTNEQKSILAQSGDNTENAFVPNIDSVSFTADYVLYLQKDTIVNSNTFTIYEYSTDATKAFYKVGFSLVGENKGNYVQISSSANGRVFKWVAPVNDKPQGNFEPIRLLVAPKSKQMVNIGGNQNIGSLTKTFFEIALSNNDINTFSDIDKSNNIGYAVKLGVRQNLLKNDTLKNALITSINYELTNRNFEPFERYQPVEFERDWNIQQLIKENQHRLTFNLYYNYKKNLGSQYEFGLLKNENNYSGYKNDLSLNLNHLGYSFLAKGSILNTNSDFINTQFIRYNADLSKSTRQIKFGAFVESERNEWQSALTDSLLTNSFTFSSVKVYIENSDSSVNKYNASYTLRNDYLPKVNNMKHASRAEDFQIGFSLLKNPKHTLRSKATYRKLEITDTSLISQSQQNNLIGRLDYNLNIFKGAISSTTFYEAGSGLEPKREFSYLRVSNGQGAFSWNDYNSNGIAELDEFEIAQFQDQANYIRIFTPSTEYIKTFQNEFSEVLNLRPNVVWKAKKGVKKLISHFSNQVAYQINQKSTNDNLLESLNPFNKTSNSIEIITINQSLRNTFSFKTSSSKFGMDYIYLQNKNKMLLTNGFDEREKESHGLRWRWLFIPDFILTNYSETGNKKYYSEFFSTKNYILTNLTNELSLQYMPGFQTKIEISYKYNSKENTLSIEQSFNHNIGAEINYGIKAKGNLQLKVNYLNIKYNSTENTSLAYEMLEGLKPGNNATWNLAYQQKFEGNIELTLFYNGRYSENIKIIHTGSIQLRAYF
ncbi:MAG: hypothetical protein A2W99_11325 [Bacteroidetes bacterium GWF2_33_16]|nr:MAG: hypothetical protein A2X00_04415 [Bacteroidetes bacterium GWE2_32_14]OFY04124.1 MAG: hypothetical protein A2W99_11325 [Bacteroidetes bacterium GWF2_33_16]